MICDVFQCFFDFKRFQMMLEAFFDDFRRFLIIIFWEARRWVRSLLLNSSPNIAIVISFWWILMISYDVWRCLMFLMMSDGFKWLSKSFEYFVGFCRLLATSDDFWWLQWLLPNYFWWLLTMLVFVWNIFDCF